MQFKDYIDKPCGIRFMFDSLELISSYARRRMLASEIMTTESDISRYYSLLEDSYKKIYNNPKEDISASVAALKHRISCLREIDGTLQRLENGVVLDDIDLFEIKYISMLSGSIANELQSLDLNDIVIPDLSDVVAILDPDGMKIESFYVYDSYSKELTNVRRELKKYEMAAKDGSITSDRELELIEKEKLLEREIREELSKKIKQYSKHIIQAMNNIADVDILLAKLLQIRVLHLCFPKISHNLTTSYRNMFHPQIVDLYQRQNQISGVGNKQFTPIDLEFSDECISIIGANMGGKSVVLQMLALNQILFQFGFGVAAESATIDIKEDILFSVGDDQNIDRGLSSFAAEMKAIDAILARAESDEKLLALIDEPARTTNPIEGAALVASLLKIFSQKRVSVVITTHYNVEGDNFRRFRVNGLVDGKMDYRLKETSLSDIPHEAINIAKTLGINQKWIELAEKELN